MGHPAYLHLWRYDGLDYNANPSDDVYILSLPSFQMGQGIHWYEHTQSQQSLVCQSISDQMLAIGGPSMDQHCLEGGVMSQFQPQHLEVRG